MSALQTPPSQLECLSVNAAVSAFSASKLGVIRNNIDMNYPDTTIRRADRALSCSPFTLHLFQMMQRQGVSLQEIAGRSGVAYGYTLQSIAERSVENDLLWLIQVGLLRREVDGQGLTDSFRLTPLGRQIIDRLQQSHPQGLNPSWIERFQNICGRWLQFSN